MITSSASADLNIIGFDEVEAARLKVKLGDTVSVFPTDNGALRLVFTAVFRPCIALSGKIPTVGKLAGLNKEEVAVETRGSSGKPVHCHFPRLYYSVVSEASASKL